jgi:hypothetical protein
MKQDVKRLSAEVAMFPRNDRTLGRELRHPGVAAFAYCLERLKYMLPFAFAITSSQPKAPAAMSIQALCAAEGVTVRHEPASLRLTLEFCGP